jgi:hypothetical protein
VAVLQELERTVEIEGNVLRLTLKDSPQSKIEDSLAHADRVLLIVAAKLAAGNEKKLPVLAGLLGARSVAEPIEPEKEISL